MLIASCRRYAHAFPSWIYDAGKTEVLVCSRGKGSVAVRRDSLSPDEPFVAVPFPDHSVVRLRLVEKYQHLGNLVCTSAACMDHVKTKTQSADGVFRRLQSTLLRNPELTSPEKVLLVNSMVLAKVRYRAGLWVTRSAAKDRCVHTALSKYWRMGCRSISGLCTKHLDERDVAAILGVPSAAEAIWLERCRQLCVVSSRDRDFFGIA